MYVPTEQRESTGEMSTKTVGKAGAFKPQCCPYLFDISAPRLHQLPHRFRRHLLLLHLVRRDSWSVPPVIRRPLCGPLGDQICDESPQERDGRCIWEQTPRCCHYFSIWPLIWQGTVLSTATQRVSPCLHRHLLNGYGCHGTVFELLEAALNLLSTSHLCSTTLCSVWLQSRGQQS